MIVCSCHRVSERRIAREIRDGADTVDEVGRRCDAGTDCGACKTVIEEILVELDPRRSISAA